MSNGEKVKQLGLVREAGYSYFIKKGAVWRKREDATEQVMELGIVPDSDYIYFVDPDGDLSRRPRAAPAAPREPAGPVPFATAFAPLRPHVGAPVFLTTVARSRGLRAGRHAITVLDWSALDREARDILIESHLFELAKKLGTGWDAQLVPVAMIEGESHPVPLDELDQQANGVLLLDLRDGGAVVLCDDPSTDTTARLAATAGELAISAA